MVTNKYIVFILSSLVLVGFVWLWIYSNNEEFTSYKDKYAAINSAYADLDGALPSDSGNTYTSGNTYSGTVDLSQTKYDADISQIANIQYHASEADIVKTDPIGNGVTWIFDDSGNIIPLPTLPIQGNIVYYAPGSYPFGTSNYVPNYEDSVYLSRLTGLSYTSPVYDTASMMGGFCSNLKNSPEQLEQACISQNKTTCGSTSCCVLLGGSKCVAGNELGPTNKANYGDIYIRNRDFYYYQGKCYGNCQ
jgi:hypothetical protein